MQQKKPRRKAGFSFAGGLTACPAHRQGMQLPRLEIQSEADAGRTLTAAECRPERNRRAAHPLSVAHRQALLPALEPGTDRDPATPAVAAGGIDRPIGRASW